jgi:hypothetical protein
MELRHAVAYLNDAVVPQVRRESISAMRSVADTLRSLADRMETKAQAGSQSAAGSQPSAGTDSQAGPNQSGPKGPQS